MPESRSVLPADLLAALGRVGARLERQQSAAGDYDGIAEALNALPPSSLPRAEREISEAAGLSRWTRAPRDPLEALSRWLLPGLTSEAQLRHVDGLEYLFLFHRDGRLREAALRKMAGPIPSAFLFAAIASRLNDWAVEVRAAAADCAARLFPITAPGVVAGAAMVLLPRQASWGRWEPERAVLDWVFARDDVTAALADRLATGPTGPSATILRSALRSDSIDVHLPRLARDAVQPAVRSAALQALIEGSARWPDGWRYRWIDKSMGTRQAEPVFATRALAIDADRAAWIGQGLRDRSPAVRNLAVSALMRHRNQVGDVRPLAEPLLNDRSPRLRDRAAFLLRMTD